MNWTTQQDHKDMMQQLGIARLRNMKHFIAWANLFLGQVPPAPPAAAEQQ